ncbi:unnamed protein product [Coregonus sp. 'balchen']|nr:unnamed protein product [Coregonus sp. 'balchen']
MNELTCIPLHPPVCVSDHFTQVLHCEHECVRDLSTRPGRLSPMENYLPLHYDYLQFAYFQSPNCLRPGNQGNLRRRADHRNTRCLCPSKKWFESHAALQASKAHVSGPTSHPPQSQSVRPAILPSPSQSDQPSSTVPVSPTSHPPSPEYDPSTVPVSPTSHPPQSQSVRPAILPSPSQSDQPSSPVPVSPTSHPPQSQSVRPAILPSPSQSDQPSSPVPVSPTSHPPQSQSVRPAILPSPSLNMVEEALACAQSYLLFHEGEEFMTENKAEWYLRRHKQELELLMVGSENMHVELTEGHYWTSTGGREDSNRIPSGTDGWMEYVPISEKKNFTLAPPQELREGTTTSSEAPCCMTVCSWSRNSQALNGTQRVLLDDVMSVDECAELKNLAHTVTMAGDGYRGKMSPHTPNEKFEGATVLKALQYGYEGRVPLRSARLFYDVSERARRIIESYFLLNSTLHFSYTHLVCRTAITGQQDHRNDLSHPIHADNCLLDPEANECWKEPPAYTYRDYSALLYLNGDFEGGEFIFTEMDAKTVTAQVKPQCGRMVGFSSGGENPHGVRAVTRGQRCAVALWFTLDPLFKELERLQADEVVQALDNQSSQSKWDTSLNINPKDEL